MLYSVPLKQSKRLLRASLYRVFDGNRDISRRSRKKIDRKKKKKIRQRKSIQWKTRVFSTFFVVDLFLFFFCFYFFFILFKIIGYCRLKRSGKYSPISHCRAIVFYTWSATIVGVLACVLREIFKVNICSGNTCRTSCLAIISYVIYEQTVYVLKNATIISDVCRVQNIIIVFLF